MRSNNIKVKIEKLKNSNFSLYSGLIFVLIFLSVALSVTTDTFATSTNITNVLRQVSIMGILGAGMGVLMVTGDLDLSVGSGLGFLGALMALMVKANVPFVVAVLGVLLGGVVIGIVEGFFVAECGMPAFVVTLAFEYILRGALYLVTNGTPITKLPDYYINISLGELFGISWPVWIMIAVYIIIAIIMGKMKLGRELYALGGNYKAAEYAGINVKLVRIKGFVIMGCCVAVAGILQTARLGSAQPAAGTGMELEAITASALGGMNAGTGSIIGVLFGSIVLGVITNGMTLLEINTYLQRIVKGMIIIGAVLYNLHKDKFGRKNMKNSVIAEK